MSFNLNDYEPVETRLARFWKDHEHGRIYTKLVSFEDGQVLFRAEVFRDQTDDLPTATGYAHETVTSRGVNSTSAVENCETSAIGRALANMGYGPKGKRPSREEMTKAQRPPAAPSTTGTTPDPSPILGKRLIDATTLDELNIVAKDIANTPLEEHIRDGLRRIYTDRKTTLEGTTA